MTHILSQHRDTQETLAVLDRLDLDTDKPSEEELAKRFGYEDDFYSGTVQFNQLFLFDGYLYSY